MNGGPEVARGRRRAGPLVPSPLPVPLDDGLRHRARQRRASPPPPTRPTRTADSLLRNADLAMYLAKAQGKNRLVVYADGMAEAARRRAALPQDLAGRRRHGQLEVHYQPTVRLTDGRTTGFEALVRWNHPERGLVPPVEFIPLAEESGDHHRASARWVLREALRQGAAWSPAHRQPLRMAVNLSPRQLLDGGVVADVDGRAARRPASPPASSPSRSPRASWSRTSTRSSAQLEALRALGVAHRHRRLRHRLLRAVLPAAASRPTSSRSTAASSATCRRAARRPR